MRDITKVQISQIHAILSKFNLMDDKRRIISEISNGRTESTTALTFQEAQNWINAMNKAIQRPVQKKENPGQKMINSVIAMAREMGVITRQQVVKPGVGLVWESNYDRFNKWMLESSCLKKRINDYTYEELNKLVSQYKAIYADWLKKYH